MSRTRKQQHAYQKRRWQKRQQRAEARAIKQRRRLIVFFVVGAILVIALLVVILVLSRPDNDSTVQPEAEENPAPSQTASLPTTEVETYEAPPDPEDAEGRSWQVAVQTSQGDIELELDGAAAPQAVSNFLRLADDGFYEGTGCHRLLPDSLLQCGDPSGTGQGDPGYGFGPIENAPHDDDYPAGTVAMARQADNAESQGSQFFLVFSDVPLPADEAGGYTVFGHVTEGLDILEEVGAAGTVEGSEQPALPVTIEGVRVS